MLTSLIYLKPETTEAEKLLNISVSRSMIIIKFRSLDFNENSLSDLTFLSLAGLSGRKSNER